MPTLPQLRRSLHNGNRGVATEIADVVVIGPGDGGADEEHLLPAAPAHQLVVDALPRPLSVTGESFVAARPRNDRPVRLEPGRSSLGTVTHWFTARIGRPVLAPHGRIRQAKRGALSVDSSRTSGWGWLCLRQAQEWAVGSCSAGESSALAAVTSAEAEPLRSGAEEKTAPSRHWLSATLPRQPETPMIVLGSNEVVGVATARLSALAVEQGVARLGRAD